MFENIKTSKDPVFEVLTLVVTLFFALTFTLQVVVGVLGGSEEQTFRVASAALLSLGVLAGICFAYATLLEGNEARQTSMVGSGLKLFYSVVLVVIAGGTEWFTRLYLVPPYSNYGWVYWPFLSILAVSNTLFFWRAITYAYKGMMELKDTLWQLLMIYRAKSN